MVKVKASIQKQKQKSVSPASKQVKRKHMTTKEASESDPRRLSSNVLVVIGMSVSIIVGVLWSYKHRSDDNSPTNYKIFTSNLYEIDRRHNLSLDEFIEKYDGKRPVIITDQVCNWRAMNWTKTFLVKNYGRRKVFMKATQGQLDNAESLGVILALFASHLHEGKPHMWTYMEDEHFIEQNPELRKDLGEPIYLQEDFFQLFPREVRPWNAMLLWGTAHSRSSLHIDPYNWTGTNAVFLGRKKWKLYPPGQDDYLYVMKNKRCNFPLDCFKYNSPIDAYEPDLKKYPLFLNARAITFVQQPGELLIIPPGWFHQAYNLEETLAVSSQVMNTQNANIVLNEIFKAGEIDRQKMPSYFENLSPVDQVQVLVQQIPTEVLLKGKKLTEGILKQLEY